MIIDQFIARIIANAESREMIIQSILTLPNKYGSEKHAARKVLIL